jgi:signal transduction histidine kinase/CheY-like chemotaxis protein
MSIAHEDSSQRMKIVADFTPVMVIQFNVETMRITFFNEYAQQWYKVNKHKQIAIGSHWNDVSLEKTREALSEKLDLAIKTRQKQYFDLELTWVKKGNVDMCIVGSFVPIIKDNKVAEIMYLLRDCTEERRMMKTKSELALRERLADEATNKMKLISNFIPVMIEQFTLDLKLTMINSFAQAFMLDLTGKRVTQGMHLHEYHSSSGMCFLKEKMDIVLKTKKEVKYDADFPVKKGEEEEKSVSLVGCISPIFDDNNNIIEILHMIRTVTYERIFAHDKAELILKEEMANESNRQKSEFVVHMSHELRTPLTGLLGLMDHLFSVVSMTEEQKTLAEEAQQSGEMLLLIINDVLDLSKIESGKMEIENYEFSMDSLIQQACKLVKHSLKKNGVSLIVNIDPSLHSDFNGDPLRLKQMLVNLLSNAIKFSNKKPIVLSVNTTDHVPTEKHIYSRSITFTVQDQGIGISNLCQQRLFKSFRQAEASTQRIYGGSGLGLSICDKLVNLMDGSISCESFEKVGSRFWFTVPLQETKSSVTRKKEGKLIVDCIDSLTSRVLNNATRDYFADQGPSFVITDRKGSDTNSKLCLYPVEEPDRVYNLPNPFFIHSLPKILGRNPEEKSEGSSPSSSPTISRTKNCSYPTIGGRVLVVDDNPINRKVLCIMLSRLGIVYETCTNGLEAVEKYKEDNSFHLIFMDCQMPVMDGYESTRVIRKTEKERKIPAVPIIAVTANSFKEDEERCLKIGMDGYLSKPFQYDKVYSAVSFFMNQKRKRKV